MTLVEVFGEPWRIVYSDQTNVDKDLIEQAAESVDKLGSNATGALPPGVKIQTEMPGKGAGDLHKDVIYDSNDELAKLVLGETRTTEAKPSALGSAGDVVAQEVSNEVKVSDGWNLSDLWTDQYAADIIVMNFGLSELDHCPRIEIPYELPPNRETEANVTGKVLSFGIPLKEDEVYERVGFAKPAPGDRVIQQTSSGSAAPGMPPATSTTIGVLPGGTEDASPLGEDDPAGANNDLPTEETDDAQLGGAHGDPLALRRAARVLDFISKL
jgi:phage gp29-like protein